MHFKQPEILYALLLLIIPIIVHLFQLQRFVKIPFTNVQFLKKLELKTRKSSHLKKWLILLTRLLAFGALILAFSQPYFSDAEKNKKFNTTIYLDNSLSMQFKNQEGEILRNATQKIINNIDNNTNISLITNDKIFKNLSVKNLKNELINIKYSSKKINLNTISLKSKQLNLNEINTINNTILISDFQNNTNYKKENVTNVTSPISLVNLSPKSFSNISIDSVYISSKNSKEITIKAIINNTNFESDNVSISLYNNSILAGKTSTTLLKNKTSEVQFKILNQENFNGKIILEDEDLTFDNSFYFAISKSEKINIISIGKRANYLSKIYTKNEFNFIQKNLQNLDYNNIQNQNLIILNELDKIPSSFINILKEFYKNGGNLVIIPAINADLASYNQFFNQLNLGKLTNFIKKELRITSINFNHPLFSDVFENQIQNFQYPSTKQQYQILANNSSPIISFENGKHFISEIKSKKGSAYILSSPINKDVSNFNSSPLIVPVFYNFGKYSYQIPQLYYTIGDENLIDVKTSIKKDEILKIRNQSQEFIPLQNTFHNKVQLSTNDQPSKSGFYEIINKNKTLRTIAFNYNKEESKLNYPNLEEIFKGNKNVTISNSISETFSKLNKQQQIKPLFKWFLALTVLFLLLEIFILKFFKV